MASKLTTLLNGPFYEGLSAVLVQITRKPRLQVLYQVFFIRLNEKRLGLSGCPRHRTSQSAGSTDQRMQVYGPKCAHIPTRQPDSLGTGLLSGTQKVSFQPQHSQSYLAWLDSVDLGMPSAPELTSPLKPTRVQEWECRRSTS